MEKLCFAIQGKTFLKSMMPLIIFSNKLGIQPIIFCFAKRRGKPYDNIDVAYLKKVLTDFKVFCELVMVNNNQEIIVSMRANNLCNIVCQDAQHHFKELCSEESICVFSIGIFFDTLHYANDLRLKRTDYENESKPNVVYFPDKKFKDEFIRIFPTYNSVLKSLGSPFYDHALFAPKHEKTNKSVSFLVTLQNLVDISLQKELESFMEYCVNDNIDFFIKTKYKTPWVLQNKKLLNKINVSNFELGFPYTSLSVILNTDIHISSYSTSAIESSYFGKPTINLETVAKNKLTYAINSIKHDYSFDDIFNSDICKTVSSNIKDAYLSLVNIKKEPKEILTFESNNSVRILKDIKNFL
jgi:hypothetical protein